MAKSTVGDLTERLTGAQAPSSGLTLAQLLDARAEQLREMLPDTWDIGRLRTAAATAVAAEPRLAACAPETVLAALLRCAQINLEPGALEHVFISAGQDARAVFILGYKGVIALALRAPAILSIDAQVIYENDERDITFGTEGHLHHRPILDGDRGASVAWYAYARFTNGGEVYRVLTQIDVDRRRSFADEASEFWNSSYDLMALKSALHAIRPFLPLDPEVAGQIALDEGTVVEADDGPATPAPEADVDQGNPGDGAGSTATADGDIGSFVTKDET